MKNVSTFYVTNAQGTTSSLVPRDP